jgi:integrase
MEWVFPGRDAEMPMHPVTFLGRWTKLLNQAGITYRKPHALRHMYASLLICFPADSEGGEPGVCEGPAKAQLYQNHRRYLRASSTGRKQDGS